MHKAELEQRHLEEEIDIEAASLIRQRGIPLYEALEIARSKIRIRRQEAAALAPKPEKE